MFAPLDFTGTVALLMIIIYILIVELLISVHFVVTVCVLAMAACCYAIKIEKDGGSTKQACDINDIVSCSSVLTSEYAHMVKLILKLDENHFLNLSNAQYGLISYFFLILFQFYPFTLLPYYDYIFLAMTSVSVLASFGLAYILRYVLKQFCAVCVFMYFLNVLLFVSSVLRIQWNY